MTSRPVTMKDVARIAGVSQSAVSFAYNRPEKLSFETRAAILAVARRLGYAGPNAIARSLRSGRTGTIGLMMMDSLAYSVADPSNMALMQGLVRDGVINDQALTLIPLTRLGPEGAAYRPLVDGLVVHSLPDEVPALLALVRSGLPTVVVDAPKIPGVSYVSIDDRSGAYREMQHVLERGHRKVAILTDRLNPTDRPGAVRTADALRGRERVARERIQGYVDAMRDFGVEVEGRPIYQTASFVRASARATAMDLLGAHPELTAVVCTSDEMAISVIEAAVRMGRAVPDDLSVIGFDDAPDARAFDLSTIGQPMVEKGNQAIRALLALIDDATAIREVILPTEMIARGSVRAYSLP